MLKLMIKSFILGYDYCFFYCPVPRFPVRPIPVRQFPVPQIPVRQLLVLQFPVLQIQLSRYRSLADIGTR